MLHRLWCHLLRGFGIVVQPHTLFARYGHAAPRCSFDRLGGEPLMCHTVVQSLRPSRPREPGLILEEREFGAEPLDVLVDLLNRIIVLEVRVPCSGCRCTRATTIRRVATPQRTKRVACQRPQRVNIDHLATTAAAATAAVTIAAAATLGKRVRVHDEFLDEVGVEIALLLEDLVPLRPLEWKIVEEQHPAGCSKTRRPLRDPFVAQLAGCLDVDHVLLQEGLELLQPACS
mmetsp:Transcript_35646/g.93176  ORF Transcript_35646/g.93176 Transcript_35646/m.93176 type:complete len:231 (+) Transcript_35646:752-1444(+)